MSNNVSMPSAEELRKIIERIEHVEEELEGPKADRKEIYTEAKGNGFDTKAIRKIVKIRKMDRSKRQEEEAILDTYLSALGID
jgi:uncharacterized protein (UPF0335 family)